MTAKLVVETLPAGLDDSEGEYEVEVESENEDEDWDDESSDRRYLGIQLDIENGHVTRDGVDDDDVYLSPTLKLLLGILIRREGEMATFNQLMHAWPEMVDSVTNGNVRKQISRLQGNISRFDLLIQSVRGQGFKLLDGRSPGEVE